MQEAQNMANEESPSVFTLVNLLENVEELDEVIQGPEVSFSFALELVPEHVKELESSDPVNKRFGALNLSNRNSSKNEGNNIIVSKP